MLSNTQASPFEATNAGYDASQLVKVLDIPELTHELEFATGPGTSQANVKMLKDGLQKLKDKGVISEIKQRWNISSAD